MGRLRYSDLTAVATNLKVQRIYNVIGLLRLLHKTEKLSLFNNNLH